jgi:hypothetical protein
MNLPQNLFSCVITLFFHFLKINVIHPLCDRAIFACVTGKLCCVIQQLTQI